MTPITLVYSYYDNGGMLERHCQEWAAYDTSIKPSYSAVIVDDGSQKDPAAAHLSDVGFPVALYRILPNLVWNVAGARNLGMMQAPDGWCLLTDIDHLLTVDEAARLMGAYLQGGRFYVPQRRWANGKRLHQHPNTYVLERATYWRVGGCDEDWTGYWGGGEPAFTRAIRAVAIGQDLPVTLTHFGRDDIADASTTDWGRKASAYHWTKNPALVRKARGPAYKPVNPLRFAWERVA